MPSRKIGIKCKARTLWIVLVYLVPASRPAIRRRVSLQMTRIEKVLGLESRIQKISGNVLQIIYLILAGDDEQSDWIGESSWRDDGESTSDDKATSDSAFQMILHGEHSVSEAKKNYRQRILYMSGREIRAGRRHVDNKPGYSIITSANEKVSRFLQDPTQSELKLHPMRQPEREKLRRLANLYSLSMKGDQGCPILYKTRHTTQAVCVDQVSLNRLSDYKRLRKTPPNSPNSDSTMQTEEPQISSTSFSPQIISQSQNNLSSIQANVQTFSSLEWESESMDIDVQGKPKFPDFHSKSS